MCAVCSVESGESSPHKCGLAKPYRVVEALMFLPPAVSARASRFEPTRAPDDGSPSTIQSLGNRGRRGELWKVGRVAAVRACGECGSNHAPRIAGCGVGSGVSVAHTAPRANALNAVRVEENSRIDSDVSVSRDSLQRGSCPKKMGVRSEAQNSSNHHHHGGYSGQPCSRRLPPTRRSGRDSRNATRLGMSPSRAAQPRPGARTWLHMRWVRTPRAGIPLAITAGFLRPQVGPGSSTPQAPSLAAAPAAREDLGRARTHEAKAWLCKRASRCRGSDHVRSLRASVPTRRPGGGH